MKSSFGLFRKKVGLPPGTLLPPDTTRTDKVTITLIKYNERECIEKEYESVNELIPELSDQCVNWINVDGLHDIDILQKLGDHFGLHNLLLEDITNTDHLPKFEDYEEVLFLTLKMLYLSPGVGVIDHEQLSFVLGKDFLLSFQEKKGDVFDQIRERIRTGKGKARGRKTDYLLYLLIDRIVDNYYVVLEEFDMDANTLEEELINKDTPDMAEKILMMKKRLVFLRKMIIPMVEEINKFFVEETPLMAPLTLTYFRDIYDHLHHVYTNLESYREELNSMMDLHFSNNADRMNSVMKTLTVIATIFIPLTFIAGIYGMNFEFMPELHWWWAYPAILMIMLGLGLGMFLYMRRKRWF